MKYPAFAETAADNCVINDLRDTVVSGKVMDQPLDKVYQLAADMVGTGFVFTGEHDSEAFTS